MLRISRNRKIIENILSLSILQGINLCMPLIVLPYLINIIGKSNYGKYSVVYGLIQYVVIVSAYGFGFSVTKQIAQSKNNKENLNIIFSSTIAARLILSIISFMILLCVCFIAFGEIYTLMFLLGIGIVVGDVINPIWFFQGMENMKYMTLVNFVSRFIMTLLTFLLINNNNDYIYILGIDSISYLMSGILSLFLAIRMFNLKIIRPKINDIVFQLKEGWHVFLSTVFMTLYRNSNVIILGFFLSETAVGIYAGAEKVIKAGQAIVTPISTALFPNISSKFKNNDLVNNITYIKRVCYMMAPLFLFITITVFVISPIINKVLLDDLDDGSIELIQLMSFVIFFGGMNFLLGICGLINLGMQGLFLKFVMISGLTSMIFLLLTVNFYGNISAGYSMLLTEVLLFLLCIHSYKKLK